MTTANAKAANQRCRRCGRGDVAGELFTAASSDSPDVTMGLPTKTSETAG